MLCDQCIHKCNAGKDIESCYGFMLKISEEKRLELLEEVRAQNMSIPRFCGDYNLKSQYFKKMLYGKLDFTRRVYTKLMDRLMENEEWTYEEKRFEESRAI